MKGDINTWLKVRLTEKGRDFYHAQKGHRRAGSDGYWLFPFHEFVSFAGGYMFHGFSVIEPEIEFINPGRE